MFYEKSMEKEFKTYDEQIQLLKKKNLIIDDVNHAKHILKNASYFALINGYKKPFKSDNGNYKENTRFEDIENLYEFDENLRVCMFKYLLLIERKIKSSISYHFSHEYRCADNYFNVNNYNYVGSHNIQEINKLVSILKNVYNGTEHSYINHYKSYHKGEVPLWVLINAMSFGRVSKMYSFLKIGVQQKVCNDFNIRSIEDMRNMLNMVTLFRNVCAHNERLYDYKTHNGVKMEYLKNFINVKENYTYDKERSRLFGTLICCKWLLREVENIKLFDEIKNLVNNSPIMQNTSIKPIILEKMGFPENWEEISQRR